MRRTDWSLPDPLGRLVRSERFGGKPWRPEPCVRTRVISPFCDDKALSMLADLAGETGLSVRRSRNQQVLM